jgi:RES domain-containing protein
MRVFRISKPAFVANALSGQGAAQAPGRWNSIGVRVGYTAGSVGLAMLEVLVHVDKEDVPTDRRLLSYTVPDDAIQDLIDVPPGWSELPYSSQVRAVGDQWIATGGSLALRVPSAVALHEVNILINPSHARFGEVVLIADEPLALDPRLFE